MGDRRRLGAILLTLGLLIAGTGVVGALSGGPPSDTATDPTDGPASPRPSTRASASPTATPTTAPTPTPTATPNPEALIREFMEDLVAAIRAGDVDSMLPRVHPATIERYGEAACLEELSTRAADPTYDVVIKAIRPQAPWDYVTDDVSTTIADAWTIEVDLTSFGTTSAREVHLAPTDGDVRWFTDCGTPLGASPSP